MQDLIILGTGVHAAEMAHIVERINRVAPTWNLLGHVSGKETGAADFAGAPILGGAGDLAALLATHADAFVVADNEFPKDLPLPVERLATLADPSCFIHPTARIGRGCVIYPHGFVGLNATLGDRVFMLGGCTINHDDVIEARVVAASGVTLAGYVHVEEDVYLGQRCTVRQYLRIGRNALVGMGAVVVKDVEPGAVMAGNPARVLRNKHQPADRAGVETHGVRGHACERRSGCERRSFSARTEADAARIVNAYLSAWPYSRPIDGHLFDYWRTLPEFQPDHVWIAYREGQPCAFLHGERTENAVCIHLLAVVPGAVGEGVWLLNELEEQARQRGVTRLVGPHYRSGMFYGAYVLGCEPYHPHWAVEGTEAWVRAGFRISHPGVLMVRGLRTPVEPAGALLEGYSIVPSPERTEFGAEPFGFHAVFNGEKVAHCYARLYPELKDAAGLPIGQIGNVATLEAHRGKGLAGIMTRMCLERLRDRGAGECLIGTGLDNEAALRVYEKCGFERRYNINEWSKELPA